MSDTPPPTPAPTPGPKRPWTILGRLAQAVREQNWFAVALELLIVILGVVIGFQITAWGAARSDAAQERTYLLQLAEDLRETERFSATGDSVMWPHYRATGRLLQAFYDVQRPPRDSVLTWLASARLIRPKRPVLGTAEALIATGDMALIRNDSLRSAITAYLEDMRRLTVIQDDNAATWFARATSLSALVDPAASNEAPDPAERDSLAQHDPFWPLPEGDRRDPFPFDPEEFLSNRDALTTLDIMASMQDNMITLRRMITHHTTDLREQVEAELSR